MTKRERYLKAMRNGKVDSLVWAPNFDYWLNVNKAEGTLPEKYSGMSRDDIVRSIDAYIWNRVHGLETITDDSVKRTYRECGDDLIVEVKTPIGMISQVSGRTEGEHRSRGVKEHFIKDLESLKIMKYVVEATSYEPNYDSAAQALKETGDDGIVLCQYFCVPFLQFAKSDAGYLKGIYMWSDYREEVDSLINLYFKKYLEAYTILSDGPADVIALGDNMDGVMISPSIFKEYALPFYQEVKKITAARGKILEAHWCGRTENLLGMVPESGIDILEAVVTKPMSGINMSEALELVGDEVVIQGGIPAVMVCNEGCTDEGFERYMEEFILPLKGRKGFILGMGDNVPPNAVFSRVEKVSILIGS